MEDGVSEAQVSTGEDAAAHPAAPGEVVEVAPSSLPAYRPVAITHSAPAVSVPVATAMRSVMVCADE